MKKRSNKMTMKTSSVRKTLPLLMAVCLVLTLLPMTAFAAGETITYPGNGVLDNDPIWETSGSLFPNDLSGNIVTVNSGTIAGAVYGGISSTGENVANNSVFINGGTVDGYINGGVTNGTGNATYNSVTINGGTIRDSVIGGRSISGNAINNTVTISGTPIFSVGTWLQGGMSAGDQFTGNRLEIKSTAHMVADVIKFEYIDFYLPSTIVDGDIMLTSITASDLTGVTVDLKFDTTAPSLSVGDVITLIDGVTGTFIPKNVSVSVYKFALSVDTGKLIATYLGDSSPKTITWPNPPGNGVLASDPIWSTPDSLFPGISASGNSVTVNSGTIAGCVFGGLSTGTDDVTNNSVTVNSGTIALSVFGGYSELGGTTGNSVTINGGQLDNFIFGGVGGPGGDATNNTVTISGSPIFGATTELHGGGWGVDNFTGNTLNVWNYTGSPVDQVRNFENYNFILPASLQGLEVTGGVWGPALTVTGVSVPAGVSLSVGQRIVLIEALGGGLPAGFEYDPVLSPVTTDGYTFALSLESGKTQLVATVESYKPPTTGGGGGGGGTSSQTLPAENGAVSVSYKQSGGTVTLELPSAKVTEIIDAAKDGKATLDLSKLSGATQAVFPKAALTQLAGAGLAVELMYPNSTLTLNADAVESISAQANGANVGIEYKELKVSDLNPAQRSAVRGSDIVIDINIYSGSQKITELNGELTVAVSPYNGPVPVAVWYLNEAGELEKLPCAYAPATKTVTFTLTHLSIYVLGQDEPKPITPEMPVNPFTDVFGTDWFIDDVIYVYDKGLINGTSEDPMLFSPNAPLTRGMIVTILWRLRGSPMLADYQTPFNDVDWQQYYFNAVQWASASKIVSGYGDGRFGPDDYVTRQDLACILLRYMNHMEIVKPVTQQFIIFTDGADISDYAADSIQTMNKLGIINGTGTNANGQAVIDPKGNATRAQAAAMLHRFVELINE